jgi:nucleotide-binding universal stress UspA family protein
MVPGISRLIVGTSGSPGSLRALRYGEFLARAHHAVLMPVIAWEPPGGERAERIQPSGLSREESRNQACQRLRGALVAVWGEIPNDPMVEPHLERGPAGWVRVSLACQPTDVLVVGSGRRSAAGWMRSSTVTRYCLAHAQCPVLAVPPPELARELGHGRLARMLRHRPLTAEQVLGDQSSPPN